MEKLNIAEILKDCPKGMELDCTMFDNVTFVRVDASRIQFPIEITVGGIRSKYLTKEGCFHDITLLPEAKCVIFPKGKTTWEGFQRPFKDGDIIYNRFQKRICIYHYREDGISCISWCRYHEDHREFEFLTSDIVITKQDYRLATKEEKQKLFDAIKENGYKWNPKTKTLEKLIVLKFKVGDRIRDKRANKDYIYEISKVYNDSYALVDHAWMLYMKYQDNYELVPNKFDITTLKPFDKVLVRDSKKCLWSVNFYSSYNKPYFKTISGLYCQCIPYNNNTKHLLGTDNDCDEYYKTWE